jgi:hypothetical protein
MLERRFDRSVLFDVCQEREKAREERKKYIIEYRAFLESCDFIKVRLGACNAFRLSYDGVECCLLCFGIPEGGH